MKKTKKLQNKKQKIKLLGSVDNGIVKDISLEVNEGVGNFNKAEILFNN